MKNKMQEIFYGHLDRLFCNRLSYAVWGAGKTGIETLTLIKEYTKGEHLPEFIIDNNPALWERGDVVSPTLFFVNHKDQIDTVFVCVYVADEVEEQLRREGFVGNVVPVSTTAMGKNTYFDFFKDYSEQIGNLLPTFNDEQSRDTLKVLMEVTKTGDVDLWNRVNGKSEDKLLDKDILKISINESFVDIGAFIGDSTKRFIEITSGNYKKIVGLEPDPENYRILRSVYREYDNAFPLPYAAGKEDGDVYFVSNQSESGKVSDSGDIKVPGRCLDGLDIVQDASLIKISANGHEFGALKGAYGLIEKNKPKLSYYCGKRKLWLIPNNIRKINPEYKVYLRHYGIGLQAMIGYATID